MLDPIGQSKARCPRCRSTTLTIYETAGAISEFKQVDGKIDTAGWHEGSVIGISGKCENVGMNGNLNHPI